MKPSIRVLTLALAFVMMLGLSGVGHAAAEADRSITVTENWTFDAGFYPVLSPFSAVLEVKYNGFLLSYLRDLLNEVERSELSVSKYCLARSVCLSLSS